MAADPRIRFVEQNFTTETPQPQISGTQWTWFNGEYLWHLDRVDEVSWEDRDSKHNMCTEGRSVYAYVIDTGVQSDHPQFEDPSRVVHSVDFSEDRTDKSKPFTADVTNGCTAPGYEQPHLWHGTAVASVLAGTQVGVAKPQVVSLKIAQCLNGQALTADLIDATDWIADPNSNPYISLPGVVNHSGFVPDWKDEIEGGGSQPSAYSVAVEGLVNATNKPFFTSADNFTADACLFAPNDRARTSLRSGYVFVVGGTSVSTSSTDPKDYRFQFWEDSSTIDVGHDSGSNSGACVSIYAPATSIYAARHSLYRDVDENLTLYDRATGTSFASPIVAGIAARYMERQKSETGSTPGSEAVYSWLLANASAEIYLTTTDDYWFCLDVDPNNSLRDQTWLSSPPAQCPSGTLGYDTQQQTWGAGYPPYKFNVVGNASGARMVYWNEAAGSPTGECE
ncbi:MAG: S8 family serine peptidase [Acidobacteria bacterium]|nr:S8 family serine peptidase [Acidobacteriota bacterium]